MKTLVKSRICRYWETWELPLDEETIQKVNKIIAAYTNGTAPVITEEDIIQCYSGDEIAEHLEVEYDCYGNQMWLCSIVNDVLDQLINEREIECTFMDVDYEEDSVID